MAPILEKVQRLFYRRETHAAAPAEVELPDRFARFRPRPPRAPAPPAVNPAHVPTDARSALAPTASRSALEQDAYLLWQETEVFGERPPNDLGETQQRPIGPHLWVVAGIAWLFTIDPVFRALTPRHFSGIPAPQLIAVLFVMPVLLCTLMAFWARGLGPRARVWVRTQAFYWKRWLAIALALLWATSRFG